MTVVFAVEMKQNQTTPRILSGGRITEPKACGIQWPAKSLLFPLSLDVNTRRVSSLKLHVDDQSINNIKAQPRLSFGFGADGDASPGNNAKVVSEPVII